MKNNFLIDKFEVIDVLRKHNNSLDLLHRQSNEDENIPFRLMSGWGDNKNSYNISFKVSTNFIVTVLTWIGIIKHYNNLISESECYKLLNLNEDTFLKFAEGRYKINNVDDIFIRYIKEYNSMVDGVNYNYMSKYFNSKYKHILDKSYKRFKSKNVSKYKKKLPHKITWDLYEDIEFIDNGKERKKFREFYIWKYKYKNSPKYIRRSKTVLKYKLMFERCELLEQQMHTHQDPIELISNTDLYFKYKRMLDVCGIDHKELTQTRPYALINTDYELSYRFKFLDINTMTYYKSSQPNTFKINTHFLTLNENKLLLYFKSTRHEGPMYNWTVYYNNIDDRTLKEIYDNFLRLPDEDDINYETTLKEVTDYLKPYLYIK